ncbi:MAG: methenyltetrahydrofolate cyclohydrolase [Thermoplasmata archaeon HGW-Thermoplasmata-1]|nr:MAG: methenyltetrahydrofolate cyclohydrolase [Thermoplasmata archaeon HGW-Thermoplasmata-1]
MTLKRFLDETASSNPAPGGGSVAALAGALGTSLSEMVANLTIGKEKYAGVEKEMAMATESCKELRGKLLHLVDEDTKAFNGVMAAFKMAKETDDEKKARSAAIQKGYKEAALVPLETARTCGKVLHLAKMMAEKGNSNSITDAGVAALMARGGLRGAAMNVSVNLGSIKDEGFVKTTCEEVTLLLAESEKLENEIMEIVREKLSQ